MHKAADICRQFIPPAAEQATCSRLRMNMSKYFWFNVSTYVLIFASVMILAIISLTQSAGMQLTVIQSMYWSIDKSWLMIRIAAQLFAALAGFIILIFFRRRIASNKSLRYGMGFSVFGLVIGLVVFYGYSCCNTPILFLFGFPFSWLRGLSSQFYQLPIPIASYLFLNITKIKWYLDIFSLLLDFLFWYSIGILYFLIAERSNLLELRGKGEILLNKNC